MTSPDKDDVKFISTCIVVETKVEKIELKCKIGHNANEKTLYHISDVDFAKAKHDAVSCELTTTL